jgi:hypothetical protein
MALFDKSFFFIQESQKSFTPQKPLKRKENKEAVGTAEILRLNCELPNK